MALLPVTDATSEVMVTITGVHRPSRGHLNKCRYTGLYAKQHEGSTLPAGAIVKQRPVGTRRKYVKNKQTGKNGRAAAVPLGALNS
jgi:hypothetical protein